jgi:predicted AAA+ superfamily ATPase
MSFNLQTYIPRQLEGELVQALDSFPVTAILSPRQCGKSTLIKHIIASGKDTLFLDLQRPSDLCKLTDPELFFRTLRNKPTCIDESYQVITIPHLTKWTQTDRY